MYVSLRDYLCTPYICVIKGLPVHHTSVSLRGYLYTPYVCVVKGLPLVCTPYICVIKGVLKAVKDGSQNFDARMP